MDENNNDRNSSINFNNLSSLFKEYTISEMNFNRLQSISFSDTNVENFRKNFFDLYINKDEEFSEIITKKLDQIKTNSYSEFKNYMEQMNQNFDKFKDKLLSFIDSKEKKISNVPEPEKSNKSILKYATQNIFKKINNTMEICENIINNIEQNFKLLNIFFEQSTMINTQRQTENFLMTNYKLIENCSIINKFNFTELDTTNLNKIDYYKFYIKYLSQKKIEVEGFAKNYLIKKEDLQNGIRFIMENFSGLEKLKLEGINNNEFLSILENIEINIKNSNKFNLKTLDLKNFGAIDLKIDNNKLNNIKKLKIQKGTFMNISTVCKLFIEENKNLLSLSLDYINMTNMGFKLLISSLIKNPDITNTLEYLSLEGNRITIVKYDKKDNQNQNKFFQNLKTLNLSKNGIYKFQFFLEALPKLKFLDLTSNNLPTSSFMEKAINKHFKDKLVLLNDNMFITNSKNYNNTYINYLNERLPKFDFEIKNLNLNFTYDIEKQSNLEKLKLSTNVVISLIKLDLSFCGLCTDVLVNFFKNNPKFLSLRSLILRYNNIKGDFFGKILSNEEICFENINFIELSENEIVCESFEKIENLVKFIKKHQNLESIQLINTGFFNDLNGKIKDKNTKDENFKEIFLDLKEYLSQNKRDFKFIVNEGNATFVRKDFQNLFSFKFS